LQKRLVEQECMHELYKKSHNMVSLEEDNRLDKLDRMTKQAFIEAVSVQARALPIPVGLSSSNRRTGQKYYTF
jgi:hypothetical protein